MESALAIHRLHFAFTVTFHYLFPQLTMGLALLIVILKTLALWKDDERYNRAARFWAKIFAINFVIGVVTGIPMEFQFGTNWARFSQYCRRRHRPDAGDGRRLRLLPGIGFPRAASSSAKSASAEGPLVRGAAWSSSAPGSPASSSSRPTPGCSIPVGYEIGAGRRRFSSPASGRCCFNPWAFWQYLHNMSGAVVTGVVRHGRGRRVLPAVAAGTSEYGRHLRAGRRDRRG